MSGKILRVCIDLDDTLIDTASRYGEAAVRMSAIVMGNLGTDCPPPARLMALADRFNRDLRSRLRGNPERFALSWIKAYGEAAGELFDMAIAAKIRRTAEAVKGPPYRPFPEMEQALREIREAGHSLHLITAGDVSVQSRKIAYLGIGGIFATVDIVPEDKTAPLSRIAGHCPDLTVMVGDSLDGDILPANRMGIFSVRVMRQERLSEKMEAIRPDRVISRIGRLPAVIREIAKN